MKRFSLVLIVLTTLLASCKTSQISWQEGVSPLDEGHLPRELADLAAKLPGLADDQADALVQVWRQWMDKRPIPILNGDEVTFVHYAKAGSRVDRVALSADFNGFSASDNLHRLPKTRLYYKTYQIPRGNHSFGYHFMEFSGEAFNKVNDDFNNDIQLSQPRLNRLKAPDDPNGHLELLGPVPAPAGSQTVARELIVYLPPGYNPTAGKSYPVLYMMDGQNLWDAKATAYGSWGVEPTANQLILSGKIEPLIIVGIPNSPARGEEYVGASMLYKMPRQGQDARLARAARLNSDFLAYVNGTVKPLIEKTYRVKPGRENTAVGGSSFGAAVSLQLGFTYPDSFGRIAALSFGNYSTGSDQWTDKPYAVAPWLIDSLVPGSHKAGWKIWLDCGNQDVDAEFLPRMQELAAALKAAGFTDKELTVKVFETLHNEQAWAQRLGLVLMNLFPPPKN